MGLQIKKVEINQLINEHTTQLIISVHYLMLSFSINILLYQLYIILINK